MELRPATPSDLAGVIELDATMESHRYLHVDQSGDGMNWQWKVEDRPLRDRLITPWPLDDNLLYLFKQITGGVEDGMAVVAVHDDQILGLILAQPRADTGVLEVVDLRVEFDHRREGLASAMLFQAIQLAKDLEMRAVLIQTQANNHPLAVLLAKLQFVMSGLDTQRKSNHDLVKEVVTLAWYLSLN
jgi:GNAT superfamily N-acetyltransferase